MELRLERAEGDRLLAYLRDEDGEHVLGASELGEAVAGLAGALDDLQRNGAGECYWTDDASEYRWLLRLETGRVRVAVLRMTGVVPGFQHVAYTEDDAARIATVIREAIGALQ